MNILKENEIWVDVVGYEGLYKISNLGNAKSLRFNREKILKHHYCKDGYIQFSFTKNGKPKNYLAHRLVIKHFLHDSKKEVNHIDFDKTNNNIVNLEYTSRRENTTHYNVSKKLNTSSKYVGVSWNKDRNKWIAKIKINNKTKYLGGFVDEIDAYNCYINYKNTLNE